MVPLCQFERRFYMMTVLLRTIVVLVVTLLAIFNLAFAGNDDNIGIEPASGSAGLLGPASITEYTEFDPWADAMGRCLVENRYAELGAGVYVTDQYLPVGALYTDGDDLTAAYDSSTDGMLLYGQGRIHVSFSHYLFGIGVNFPGALRIIGYLGEDLVFTSGDFAGYGVFFFGGVISDLPFDRVELMDWVDDLVYVDDIFYNPSEPSGTDLTSWGRIKALFR
jgi:hypothetical protein